MAGSRLDVVITLIDLGPVPCAVLPGSSADSVVVHGLSAGTYDAALHLRVVSAATAVDSIIARQTVIKSSSPTQRTSLKTARVQNEKA